MNPGIAFAVSHARGEEGLRAEDPDQRTTLGLRIEERLGVRVIATSATERRGLEERLRTDGIRQPRAGFFHIFPVMAKEIVVGTMGETYAPRTAVEEEGPRPTFTEGLREIGTSFAGAVQGAASNLVSTFGVSSLAPEDGDGDSPLKAAVRGACAPLSAYAFMAFVLLYMPCVVAIAMRQGFGSWKWFGVAFAY